MTRYYTAPIVREIFPPQPTPPAPAHAARGAAQRERVRASLIARPQADAGKSGER